MYQKEVVIETMAIILHSIEKAERINLLRYESRIVINGCNLSGLICIALLKSKGYDSIIALDYDQRNRNLAKKLGAGKVIYTKGLVYEHNTAEHIIKEFWGSLADLVFDFEHIGGNYNTVIEHCVSLNGGICFAGRVEQKDINKMMDIVGHFIEDEIVVFQNSSYTMKDYSNAKVIYEKKEMTEIYHSEIVRTG